MTSQSSEWYNERGQTVTFMDRRSGAHTTKTAPAQPCGQDDTIAEQLSKSLPDRTAVAGHEARHAAIGELMGFKISHARSDLQRDDRVGEVNFDLTSESWTRLRGAEFFVMAAAGGLGDRSLKSWPPTYPPRRTKAAGGNDENLMAIVVDALELSERQYHGLLDVARMLIDHRGIRHATKYMETLLHNDVVLTGPMIKDALRSGFKTMQDEVEQERLANDPAERRRRAEHDAIRDEWRTYFTSHMKASEEYAAANELRERSMRIAKQYDAA